MSEGDEYSEVSYESWFSRIGKAFTGIIVGIVLFLISFVVLWWNEGRAVQTARSLAEGKGAVVEARADKVDSANDGHLVHVTGKADTKETLKDPDFKIAEANAIKLERHVEIYQWKENKKSETKSQVGGKSKTVTTYSYEKVWSPQPINSSEFKEAATHRNRGIMPFDNATQLAEKVTVGAFQLPPDLVKRIGDAKKVDLTTEQMDRLPEVLK
jgi:hypothetical protein